MAKRPIAKPNTAGRATGRRPVPPAAAASSVFTPAARRQRPADEPAAGGTPGSLRARLDRVEAERDGLRRTVAEQGEQLRVLTDRLELLSGREADLRALLLEANLRLFDVGEPRPEPTAGGRSSGRGEANGRPAATFAAAPRDARPAGGSAGWPVAGISYRQLVARVRQVVRDQTLPGSTVVVVSKGDEELRGLDGRRGWHFPQAATGVYAGHYPADSAAAIEHLESLRARGGQYLLFPATAFWWFQHYADFKEYLDARYAAVSHEACVLYKLFQPKKGAE